MTFHAIYSLQKNIDLITEIEFQNALFSSAVKKHCDFTLIIKRNGSFAYTDDGLKEFFPGFSHRQNGLQEFFEIAGVSKSDAERVDDAMEQRRNERILFPMTTANGEIFHMILTIFPLSRPKDFYLLQGRRFVERDRNDIQMTQMGNADKYIGYLLHDLPYGSYVASLVVMCVL